jgi:SMC interacting uncharacterized protein involved in chromosome segregation
MTTRRVKEYLREIKSKRQQVERLKKRRDGLHIDVSFGSIDYSADRIQGTPQNKLENAAIKLSDALERIDTETARLKVEIDERLGSIERLQNETYRDLLFKRYSEYKSFEEISVEMRYAYNYTCNLHGVALKELSKVLK